jgi:hypothetical protein
MRRGVQRVACVFIRAGCGGLSLAWAASSMQALEMGREEGSRSERSGGGGGGDVGHEAARPRLYMRIGSATHAASRHCT